ncbi:MAG: aldehyde dehydrogenase family protein [Polyangiaceae bacterium]
MSTQDLLLERPALPAQHRVFADGEWIATEHAREIRSPATSAVVAIVFDADAALMERAIAAAAAASRPLRATSRFLRSRLLARMAEGIERRRAELVDAIVHEAGKPVTLANGEVSRAVVTFTIAAEEAKRHGGELVPVDIEPGGRAYHPAIVTHVPRGPVLAITPFNFPLNLVAHKVAPALAAGAPILVKPAPQAPGPTRLLAEIFAEAAAEVSDAREQIPLAAMQAVSAPNDVASIALRDDRLAVLSFTGSAAVGFRLQAAAPGKRVLLELGGDAAVLVHDDADLERAAARCAFGAYAYAGQVCISVQRILAHERIYDRFRELFLQKVAAVRWGDPADPDTLSGPVIDAAAADRVMGLLEEATRTGARLLTGAARTGNLITPAVVEDPAPTLRLSTEEAFGPVATIARYARLGDAVAEVNRSRYGLQAGLFTGSLSTVHEAFAGLDVGGLLVNEVPTYRADNAPYGGTKASGLGREGVRYAMEEYSERKTLIEWRG